MVRLLEIHRIPLFFNRWCTKKRQGKGMAGKILDELGQETEQVMGQEEAVVQEEVVAAQVCTVSVPKRPGRPPF
jgi:hypothetical protein